MSRNSLYPGFVKMHYTANGHAHQQILPVVPALTGGVWTLGKILGGTWSPWTDAIDAYVLFMKALYHTADSIQSAELFTLASPTAAPVFQDTYSVAVAGTSSAADVPMSESVYCFRTLPKNILRVYLMETINPVDQHLDYTALGTGPDKDLVNFLLSGDSFVFSRAEGVAKAFTFLSTKVNDKLRKKFILNV